MKQQPDEPRISFSAINMLERCGQQYYYRYVEGIRVPPGIALLQGRAVDTAVNVDLTSKKDDGKLLPVEQVLDTARDTFVAEWNLGEVRLEDEYAEMGVEKAKATGIDNSVRLAHLHHVEAAPLINPTHVQRKWELAVAGIPHKLVGVIDIQEGLEAVRDTKATKKSPPRGAADTSSQLSAYALAVMIRDGALPRRLCLDYLVNTKTPKLVTLESVRTQVSLEPFAERLFNAVRVIQAGAFMPAQPDSWVCSERWCGYWDRCPYAARPVQLTTGG